MRDVDRHVLGIRTRDPGRENRYKCVPGSKDGLFYSDSNLRQRGPLLVVEGPTDTAAGIHLGLRAVGLPNAVGDQGHQLLRQLVVRLNQQGKYDFPAPYVIVLKDQDGAAGQVCIEKVGHRLGDVCRVVALNPPAKDLRDACRDAMKAGRPITRGNLFNAAADVLGRPVCWCCGGLGLHPVLSSATSCVNCGSAQFVESPQESIR